MDSRHTFQSTQRPPPPTRAVSQHHRPPLPSRLSNVRSVSQPFIPGNPSPEPSRTTDVRNTAAFLSNRESVYTSPDVIDLEDEENERPAKRAKIGGHISRAGDETGTDSTRQTVPGSPLPQLRKPTLPTVTRNATHKTRPAAVARAARKANGLEPPAMATRLPAPRTVADFSPWNGHHPEDQMSETVVKAGYFDKTPGPNSTESSSAKPAIWPNLSQKNNMGLQTLSYLFTSVMEKRQAMGRCTAPSTFKPPPRVTVTDTKREAWLRDLANPDIPLRKQSRTIPHGIRGKVLMEQCLSKDIPMPRAAWLAKCVGANELRAFRRKGVSGVAAANGEQKWVREWTIAVEQFLEGVIVTCGQQDWQSKMDYAVKLATCFYAEQLLERDHYLDWIVSSFTQSKIDKLPISIILVQLYWKDITAFGRRGRHLAEAILGTLDKVNSGHMRINDTLRDRLRKLVMVMAVTNRGCLIMPRTWDKYRYILEPGTLPAAYASVETPAHNIAKRNQRLAGPLNKTPQNTRCALLELYGVLDGVGLHVNIEELVSICSSKVPNAHKLIAALLNWSASVFRTGSSRIYLTSKLIAQLAKRGEDVDGAVLDYLKTSSSAQLAIENVHRVVGELIRMQCFSTGRYLQWLMVSGVLSTGEPTGLATSLLSALPLEALPVHLINTRRMLMQRLGAGDDTIRAYNLAVTALNDISAFNLEKEVIALSGSGKLEFALQMTKCANVLSKDECMTLSCFLMLKNAMESAGDVPALGNLIEASLQTQDSLLLATISDTLNMHAQSFAATGRLHSLVDALLERYKIVRQFTLERACILSIAALVGRIPEMSSEARLLETDLAICESQGMVAVCSPASDSLVNMQASNLDSDDDIDRVFDSGNTMDEQLMQRLFSRIVQRASKPPSSPNQVPSKICQWFNKLRTLDIPGFDELVKSYVQACFKNSLSGDGTVSCKVVSALVASLCIKVAPIVEAAKHAQLKSASCMLIQLLTSDRIICEALHPSERLRFNVQRSCYLSDHAAGAAQHLPMAMEDVKLDVQEDGLVDFVMKNATALQTNSDIGTALHNSERLIRRILRQSDGDTPNVKLLVAQADPLSIVHRGAALRFYSNRDAASEEALKGAVLVAIASGSEVWPQLLDTVGRGTINSIYLWARDRVLDSLLQRDETATLDPDEITRHLDILDVAFHHAAKEDDGSTVLTAVVERLKATEQKLSTPDFDESRDGKHFTCCLNVLLHLSTLYGTSPSTNDNDTTRLPLLTTLCALLTHPKLQTHACILEYIHDVASAVSDTLPLDSLPKLQDPRLAQILGSVSSPDAWLALVTTPQLQGTQQQRALIKGGGAAGKAKIGGGGGAVKVPFPLRRWEVMGDATPTVGANDTSLSLGLFGARRV